MIMKCIKLVFTSAIPAFMVAACFSSRATEVPMPSKFYDGHGDDKETLVVFLPGRGDDIDSYEHRGFIETLRASNRPLDAVVVDSHLGYYVDRSLSVRIGEDIVRPYHSKGYDKFIVVGISLGGVGALWLNYEFPEQIVGTVIIAPFLGSKSTIQSVKSAGGIKAWHDQLQEPLKLEEEIWTWIDAMFDEKRGIIPCTILAYGKKDKFASAGDYLGESLPDAHVFTNDGGHKWIAWGPLWSDITNSESWTGLECHS
jgi:pimeloyl-ACP methyl ester carboxylesterase